MGPIFSYHVPGFGDYNVDAVLVRFPPAISLAVEFQEAAFLDHYIVRHLPRDGTHLFGEKIQLLDGRVAWNGADLRTDIPTEQSMLEIFRRKYPHLRVRGNAGFANVTMNPSFVAWANGRLACTRPDLDRISNVDSAYCGVVVDQDCITEFSNEIHFHGDTESGENVRFRIGARDLTEATRFVVCGPQLVREGAALTDEWLKASVLSQEWYDLRHVILFPHIHWTNPELDALRSATERDVLSINPGLEAFWRSDGTLHEEAIKAFFAGEPVIIDLAPYTEVDAYPYFRQRGAQIGIDRLLEAFEAHGYRKANSSAPNRGEYYILGKQLAVTFLPGIYNHSLVGIGHDGSLLWMGIKGLGGRVGVTLTDMAQLAVNAGFFNAIVCDNGGDVHLSLTEDPGSDEATYIIHSANERRRFRGLLLFVERRSIDRISLAVTSRATVTNIPVGDLRSLL